MKASVVFGMTTVAAGVSWPFLEEDRLDTRSECLESIRRRRRSRLRCRRARRRVADPGSEPLPFLVGPRHPKFPARVSRDAAPFLRQRVEEEEIGRAQA